MKNKENCNSLPEGEIIFFNDVSRYYKVTNFFLLMNNCHTTNMKWSIVSFFAYLYEYKKTEQIVLLSRVIFVYTEKAACMYFYSSKQMFENVSLNFESLDILFS